MKTERRAGPLAIDTERESCVACPNTDGFHSVETHTDRTNGITYRLISCPRCGVVFSEPRQAVGVDWYAKTTPTEPFFRPDRDWRYERFFQDDLPRGEILDMGCGYGFFLQLAKEKGYGPCTGFDYDGRKVESVRSKGISVFAEDWETFCRKHKDSQFDIVTLFDVLEHAPEPSATIEAASSLLKPGGFLVITLPNARRPLPFGREEWDFPPHHFTRWSADTMKKFLERRGFAVVRQDASRIKLNFFLDTMAAQVVMTPLLRLARSMIFGRGARGGATMTELYASDAPSESRPVWKKVLANKRLRSFLFSSFKSTAKTALWPAAFCMAMSYRISRDDAGYCLYTLARKT